MALCLICIFLLRYFFEKKKKKTNKSFCSVSFAVSHSSTIELNVKILHQWNTTGDQHDGRSRCRWWLILNNNRLHKCHYVTSSSYTQYSGSHGSPSFQLSVFLTLVFCLGKERKIQFFKNVFKNCCTFENEILPEHFIHVHSGQPEAVRVAVIIAGASTVALDERRGSELLQTGAGRGESLTWALSTCTGVLLHRETEKSIRVKGE